MRRTGTEAERHALTVAETYVRELVARGLDNKEIAKRLGVSESTIKKHVSAILLKSDLTNRTQIALGYWEARCPSLRRMMREELKVAA